MNLGYIEYFFLTFFFATLFGISGVGSSLVLIPLFTLTGIDFNFAKALGHLANGSTTAYLSVLNYLSGEIIDKKSNLILIIYTTLSASFGAYSSKLISQEAVQILFSLFVLVCLILLFITNIQNLNSILFFTKHKTLLFYFCCSIAFIAGLLGVGGGAVYLPLFIYFGLSPKKAVVTVSTLIIPISFSAFFTYLSFVKIDWILMGVVCIASSAGGYFGLKIMNLIKNEKILKYIISITLIVVIGLMIHQNLMRQPFE